MEENIYWKIFLSYAAVLVLSIVIVVFAQVSLLSITLILVIITVYSTWLSSFFISNIDRISDEIFDISVGKFKHIRSNTRSEFRRIEDSINELQERLSRTIDELSSSKDRMKAILSSMAEGVIAIDGNENVILINSAAEKLLSLNESEVLGRDFIERIRQPELTASIRSVMSGKSANEIQISVTQPEEKHLLVHTVPIGGGGAMAVLNDITRIKELENIRSEFTSNVSHELKTPLTSIKSSAETLLDGAVNDKEHNIDFLKKIVKNSERLSALIDDILELSSLEESGRPKEVRSIKVKDVIERAIDTVSSKINDKKINVKIDLESDAMSVFCSEDHLFRVFLNLLDNAVKYNKTSGSITISGKSENGYSRFSVADTGIGIEEEHLPRIFERFYTTDKARSRELGGTGLGLSIVKHIIELYGGKVSVSSRINEGSTFTFTLKKAP